MPSPVRSIPTVIDIPLLVIGGGPAALMVATIASGVSLGSLIVGHESLSDDEFDDELIELNEDSLTLLKPHGVLNVLNPYATTTSPFTITPALFEKVLKHHCVVNMNITVYDGMELYDLNVAGHSATAKMSDGQSEWIIRADNLVDTTGLSTNLNDAIRRGAALANEVIA